MYTGPSIVQSGLISSWDCMNPKCYSTYNLSQNTEDFSQSNWVKLAGVTIVTNTSIDPNGNTTADSMIDVNASSQSFRITQNGTAPRNRFYTASVHVKNINIGFFILTIYGNSTSTNWAAATFDIVNGIITKQGTGSTYVGSMSASITPVANGFFRISITANVNDAPGGGWQMQLTDNGTGNYGGFGNSPLYTGNGTARVYLWGAQLNEGTLKPYQPVLSTPPTLIKDLMKLNNGTLTNGALASQATGLFTFDGSNDYIDYGNVLSFERTNSFTLSCWVKSNSLSALAGLISKLDTAQVGYSLQISSGGTIRFELKNSGTNFIRVTSSATITTSAWANIVITYNGSSLASGVNLYLNGDLISYTINSDTLTASVITTHTLKIGTVSTVANFLNGQVALPMIYNRVLTVVEVLQTFNSTKSRFGL